MLPMSIVYERSLTWSMLLELFSWRARMVRFVAAGAVGGSCCLCHTAFPVESATFDTVTQRPA